MGYTQKQFDKLPKWAQSEISRLKANNEYHKDRLASVVGGDTKTSSVCLRTGYEEKDICLPEHSHIIMRDSKGCEFDISVDNSSVYSQGVEIRAKTVKGFTGTLLVKPVCSNVVNVVGEKRE
jgi:hypothetical protein